MGTQQTGAQKKVLETVRDPALENIVTSRGDYLVCHLRRFDPGSIQHSDEICRDRITIRGIRNMSFSTADCPMYRVEGSDVILYLARRKDNHIFRNFEEALREVHKNGSYMPSAEEAQAIMESDTTLRINLSDLGLTHHNIYGSYFDVMAAHYDELNPPQRAFAERVYGAGDDFRKYMEMMLTQRDTPTPWHEHPEEIGLRIWVLNPEYAKYEVSLKDFILAKLVGKGKPLCRLSKLMCTNCLSGFSARLDTPYDDHLSVRGMYRKEQG